jgi:glycosyltransferase involved in cell wall biosynthesis
MDGKGDKMKTQNPLSITMYCIGMPFHGDTLKTESLGGTETACLQAAEMFAKYGHKVTVLTTTDKPGNYGGVEYRNVGEFDKYFIKERHDVSLVLRHPQLFSLPHNSKVNILWQHDLAFINDKKDFLDNTWNIDSVWCQSPFHKNQYKTVMGMPDDFYWVAGSAIDPELLPKEEIKRDKKKLVYTARPERGLEALITGIMPKLLEHDPELKLHVATYDTPDLQKMMDIMKQKAEPIKDSIVWLPPLTKKELYELFSSAYLYIYPVTEYDKKIGFFEETYCLTIDECMANGLPFISRALGAIPDTLGINTSWYSLVDGFDSNQDLEFQEEFTDRIIDILKDEEIWEKYSNKAKEIALKEDTWEVRVKGFLEKIQELMSIEKENKLSVCIYNRDQDKAHLKRCLKQVKQISDDIQVFTKDEGKEIDNESEIWNQMISEADGEWILWLYGSEELQNPRNLLKYLRNSPYEGYGIEKKKYVLKNDLNDALFDDMLDSPPRLFRKDKDIVFQGEVLPRPVNQYGGSLELNVNYFENTLKDISIIDFSDSMDSFDYFSKVQPVMENGSCVMNKDFHLMKGYMALALSNRGINEDMVVDKCEKVVDLYRKSFVGNISRMGREALAMYSKANDLLQTGFVMNFSFGASRHGDPKEKSMMNIRLNSLEDAEIVVQPLMKSKIDTIMSKYYLVRR